jgi:NAD+--asparagine ADP-ribosyltransferase
LKKYKALKHSRDEQNGGHASGAKKMKVDENDVVENACVNVEIEVQENAAITEKEGTAISVLLCLSKL